MGNFKLDLLLELLQLIMCGLLVIFLSVLILELVDAAVPAQLLDRQTINQVEDVRVVIGSFIPGYQQEEKPKK